MMSELLAKEIYIVQVTVLYEPDIYKLYYVKSTCRVNTMGLYYMMFCLSLFSMAGPYYIMLLIMDRIMSLVIYLVLVQTLIYKMR